MKLIELQQQPIRLFIDLDGVLADFQQGTTQAMGEELDQERYEKDASYRSNLWKWVKRYSEQGGELWANLPLMTDANVLWKFVKSYNPQILSATGMSGLGIEEQKKKWVTQNFGRNVRVIIVKESAEKAKYAGPNHILIDDRDKSIGPWESAGGIGILHTNAASTIEKLKKYL